jgi:hypothetical protein
MGRIITPATPGHPCDDGIYQADARYTPTLPVAVNDLPPMCGRFAPVGQVTQCLRLIRTWHLHTDLADIERQLTILARMRTDWKARNLIGNIEFRIRRLQYQLATWDLPTCACGPRALPEPTHDVESVYPLCTC